MSVQPNRALTPSDAQQTIGASQQAKRRTKDILTSIRVKLMEKYGNDEITLKCIDSCMKNLSDKDKKIRIEDFAVLECKLKK